MKYIGMPMGMWALFAGSFQKQLTEVLGYDTDTAKAITKNAKPKYKAIIADLPEFEKADRFKMNIVNCAMIGAFVLSMPERPDVEWLTEYYAKSMMTKPMKWFCRKMNFDMDSRNYALLILAGQPLLNNILSMQMHEALRQRIVINYNLQGMQAEEVADYARNRMKLCGVAQEIFEDAALEAAFGCCGGSIIRLNNLLHKALMIGCEQKVRSINTNVMLDAANEIELI